MLSPVLVCKWRANRSIRFLWVKYQLDHICEGLTDEQVRGILKSLPHTLHDTYDRISSLIGEQADHICQIVKRVIEWLVNAARGLQGAELVEAIAIRDDSTSLKDLDLISNPDRIVQICHNLVSIAPGGAFSFIHYSVREYFVSEHLRTIESQTLRSFFVDVEAAQVRLAKACLTYLCFQDIPNKVIQISGRRKRKAEELCEPPIFAEARKSMFLDYASKHFSHHLSSRAQDDCRVQLLFYRAFRKPSTESSFELAAELGHD